MIRIKELPSNYRKCSSIDILSALNFIFVLFLMTSVVPFLPGIVYFHLTHFSITVICLAPIFSSQTRDYAHRNQCQDQEDYHRKKKKKIQIKTKIKWKCEIRLKFLYVKITHNLLIRGATDNLVLPRISAITFICDNKIKGNNK